jgi:polysaccharide deacetylase 2 family uncharacterized protein YibQ
MDEKLENFVALLHRPPPKSAPARSSSLKPIRRRSFARPKQRWLLEIAWGSAAGAAIIGAVWLALPPNPAAPPPEMAAPAPAPKPPPTTIATLRFPPLASSRRAAEAASEAEEQAEMTAPDPPAAADSPAAAPAPPRPPAPPVKTAAVVRPPASPSARADQPPWLRYAVAPPALHGRPHIAIVIDDLGLDRRRTEHAIALPAPLTLSFLGYAGDLPQLAEEGHRAGHELLVHVPMEPISRSEDMGPNGLAVGLGEEEVLRRLRWNLARFDGYVGINNHMGSRFTASAESMAPVMAELKARGLLFLDSRTIARSAGVELARHYGVPHAARDVFLDNEVNAPAIDAQLAEVEAIARRNGSAVAIGHPHDATIAELARWIGQLPKKGFVLVPLSTIVREHWPQETAHMSG